VLTWIKVNAYGIIKSYFYGLRWEEMAVCEFWRNYSLSALNLTIARHKCKTLIGNGSRKHNCCICEKV
jgi:hypothetical protein